MRFIPKIKTFAGAHLGAASSFAFHNRFFTADTRSFRSLRLIYKISQSRISGEIYRTRPKKDMRKRILLNSAKIQEEEVKMQIKGNILSVKLPRQ